jgi:hypothetical protein
LSLSANAVDQISDEMHRLCYTHGKHRHDIRIQLNFLGQTAMSRCEGLLMFQELTLSPSLGCARVFFLFLFFFPPLPNHQHTVKMGMELAPETSETFTP